MDEGLRFAIREGGRTVGAGVVAKSSLNNAKRWALGAWRQKNKTELTLGFIRKDLLCGLWMCNIRRPR